MPLCLCTTRWRNGWDRKNNNSKYKYENCRFIWANKLLSYAQGIFRVLSPSIKPFLLESVLMYFISFAFFSLCSCLFLYLVAALVKNPTVLRLSKKQTLNKCECVKLSTVEVSSYTAVWIIPFNWDITHSLRFTITAYRLRFDYASNVGFILTAMRMFSFRNRCLSMGLTLEKFII